MPFSPTDEAYIKSRQSRKQRVTAAYSLHEANLREGCVGSLPQFRTTSSTRPPPTSIQDGAFLKQTYVKWSRNSRRRADVWKQRSDKTAAFVIENFEQKNTRRTGYTGVIFSKQRTVKSSNSLGRSFNFSKRPH